MTTNETGTASTNSPSYIAYHVRDRDNKSAVWTRIGGVWPHSDGKGFNIQLDAIPVEGRITLRVATEKKD